MSDSALSPRIEQFAPELERIVSTAERIEYLADGYGGAQGPAEGPVWWKEGGYLLFSDIHNNRRMKYQPGRAREMGPDLFRRLPRHPRSRHDEPLDRRLHRAERPRFLAR